MIDSALFIGKKDDDLTQVALMFLRQKARHLEWALGDWGDALPAVVDGYRGQFIFSYRSRWIVPPKVLGQTTRAALNFHPASPAYPGVGCANFALYERAEYFGVTCHHMAAKVDAGPIVALRRFPILPGDGLEELLERTYLEMILLFFEVVSTIASSDRVPTAPDAWQRQPTTWRDLRALQALDPQMAAEEMQRRIRATSYRRWQPHLSVHGHRFTYAPPEQR